MRLLTFTLLALLLALPVGAQTQTRVQVEATSADSTETSADYYLEIEGVEGEASSKGNVETEWKVEEGESATPGVEPDEIDSKNSATEEETKESGEKSGTTDINIGVGELIAVEAREVRGWDAEQKEAFLGTVKTHAQVQSEQDLENFALGVLAEDANMETISLNYEKIDVEYKGRARLFGVLPFTFTEHVTVDTTAEATDRVQVRFPWYRFLMATDISEAELKESIDAEIELDTNAKVTPSTLARVLQSLSVSLKAKHEAAMNSIRNLR